MPSVDASTWDPAWVIALVALMILHQGLSIAGKRLGEWWDHRKGNGMQGTLKENTAALKEVGEALASLEDPPPYPACHYDPLHFDRIKDLHTWVAEIRNMQETQKLDIAGGRFECRVREEHLRMLEKDAR